MHLFLDLDCTLAHHYPRGKASGGEPWREESLSHTSRDELLLWRLETDDVLRLRPYLVWLLQLLGRLSPYVTVSLCTMNTTRLVPYIADYIRHFGVSLIAVEVLDPSVATMKRPVPSLSWLERRGYTQMWAVDDQALKYWPNQGPLHRYQIPAFDPGAGEIYFSPEPPFCDLHEDTGLLALGAAVLEKVAPLFFHDLQSDERSAFNGMSPYAMESVVKKYIEACAVPLPTYYELDTARRDYYVRLCQRCPVGGPVVVFRLSGDYFVCPGGHNGLPASANGPSGSPMPSPKRFDLSP